MKKHLKRYFLPLFVYLFALSTPLSAISAPWVTLNTEKQKLEFGLWIRETLPNFFKGTFNYGMEFWNIARDQAEIEPKLKGLYPSALDERPLALITLNKAIEKPVVNAQDLENLKQTARSYLTTQVSHLNRKQLAAHALKMADDLQKLRPGDLLSGLLSVVMDGHKERGFLYKVSYEEKVAFLVQNLPEDLSATSFFRAAKGRFAVDTLKTKTQAIQTLATLTAEEAEIIPALYALISSADLPIHASATEMANGLSHLTAARLSTLEEPTVLQSTINHAVQNLAYVSELQTPTDAAAALASAMSRQIQKMLVGSTHTIQAEAPYLALEEEPRDIALFKSAAGEDCSHTCSFTKADNPYDRTFFLIDSVSKRQLGYVEASIYKSGKNLVMYVSSVNGPSITAQQTEEVFFMMNQFRKELGVQIVALAAEHLDHHMNYEASIRHFDHKVQNGKRIQLRPISPKIQEIVEAYHKVDYERADHNSEGVIYTPDLEMTRGLITNLVERPEPQFVAPAITPNKVLLFALEMDTTERWLPDPGQLTDGERAIAAAKMNMDEYRKLRAIVKNSARLPYQAALQAIKEKLAEHAIVMDKDFMNDRPYLFYDAQLSAIDALSEQNKKSTLRIAAQIIKRGMWHPTQGLKELGSHPENLEILNQSRELDNVMNWAMGDIAFHSIQLRNMAEAGIGFPKLGSPEMVRHFLRIMAGDHPWGPALSLEILKRVFPDLSDRVLPLYAQDEDADVRHGVERAMEIEGREGKKLLPLKPKPIQQAIQKAQQKFNVEQRSCHEEFGA